MRRNECWFASAGTCALLFGVVACGSDSTGDASGTGGNTNGDASAGANSAAGGLTASGGAGGTSATGGTSSRGGTGGIGAGGKGGAASGGASAGGTVAGTGGAAVGSGGDTATGGTGGTVTGTGGTAGGSGGDLGTGGTIPGTGGDASTGGTGGALGSGGAVGDGGAGSNRDAGPDAGAGGDGPDAGTGGDGPDASADGGAPTSVALNVDLALNAHPISPLIYGVNAPRLACSNPSARFTLCRLGANPWSTYNWENNASNAGSDRCFENDDGLGASNVAGQTVTSLVDEAAARASLLTVPLLDHVAADKNGGSAAPACGGDVRNSGSGYLNTRFKKSRATKGSALSTTPDAADDVVNQDEFVNFVKAHAPTAQVLFAMDNQPELWSYTHAETHPAVATYAEVISRNIEYATRVREVWPEAAITGAVGYGFQAFLDLQHAPDSAGKPDFTTYYLAAMKKAGDDAGKRLIDYLDVHWYSEANGGGVRVLLDDTTPPDPAVVAARVQGPRSLFDPTYDEQSWITNDLQGPIDLLHWLGQRIAANYPGTKLAFSAWSFGGEEHISGAIAAADTLGIFGREGVGLGAVDTLATDTSFLIGAFAAYRNYDGAGAAFGDTSVAATTSDLERISIYASTDSGVPGRVVTVVINRDPVAVAASLTFQNSASFSAASVYQLTAGNPLPQPAADLVATSPGVFTFTPPAYSISVIVPRP